MHAEIHSYEEGFTRLIDRSASRDAAGSYTDLQGEEEDDALFVMRSRLCSLHLTPASTEELWATDWTLTVECMFSFVGETEAPTGSPSRERRACKPHTVGPEPKKPLTTMLEVIQKNTISVVKP